MTVYFIRPIDDPTKIKVGTTTNLSKRMQEISADFENGIELIAQCHGGADVEHMFHQLLSNAWHEGEWFYFTDSVKQMIEPFRTAGAGKRIWSRLRAVDVMPASPIEEDRNIAFNLLQKLMGTFGAVPFGISQTKAHEALKLINPAWTRRRVRAIWERKAQRIDHFEVRDLTSAIASRRLDWAEAIAPEINGEY